MVVSHILYCIKHINSIPLALFVYFSKNPIIVYELDVWMNTVLRKKRSLGNVLWMVSSLREYRSLVYYRMKHFEWIMSVFAPGQYALYVQTSKIGPGLVFQHAFATIINAESIGNDCQVWQGVTIGKKYSGESERKPRIGNNVKIMTGSIVLGDITIGNNVTIGASSLVMTNVPDNAVVVGNPARIVRLDGKKVDMKL